MKKIFAAALAFLLVLALVPALAVSASSADKVVYLANDGEGDGSAPEKPLGTLEDAYAALGEEGGTIVIIGEFYHLYLFDAPEHTGTITITGKYNNVDYKGSIYVAVTDHFLCGGPTTFKNIDIQLAGTWVIRARFHHLTFGYGVTVSSDDGREFPQLYIVGGDQSSTATTDTNQDTHLTILSGTFLEIIGGPRSGAPADYTGKCVVEFGGTAKAFKISLGARSTSVNLGTGLLVLDGGSVDCWATAHDCKANGYTGNVQIVLTKNFDISNSFNNTQAGEDHTYTDSQGNIIYYGISGSSVFVGFEEVTRFADAELLIDPSIKATVDASGKIHPDGFTTIRESAYEGTVGADQTPETFTETYTPPVTEPPVTEPPATEPPATEPPVTEPPITEPDPTEAITGITTPPTTTNEAPTSEPANSNTALIVIIAVAAVIVVAAVVIIIVKKKKA